MSAPFTMRMLCLSGLLLPSLGIFGHAQTPANPIPAGLSWVTDGWRYHSGDNPAWAEPGFDDADWERIAPRQQTDSCSHGCWYRLRIELPEHSTTPLALLVLAQEGVFEAYIDNHRAGSPQFESWWLIREPVESILPLPNSGSVLLAIRIRPPRVAFDSTEAAYVKVAVGGEQSIHDAADAHRTLRLIRFLPSCLINLAIFLSGFVFLVVFRVQQRNFEYFWLGLYLMILSSSGCLFTASIYAIVPGDANEIYADPAIYLYILAQTEFTFAFIRRKPNRLWRAYEAFLVACPVLSLLCSTGLVSNGFYFAFESASIVPAAMAIPALLFYWHRHGNREARWLILPSLAPAAGMILTNAPYFGALLGWDLDFLSRPVLLWGTVPLFKSDLAALIFLLAIAAVMVVRFTALNREQARTSAELAAAREMQRQLVPADPPAICGYRLDVAYIPAAEVGGDFYQVLPQLDGSSLLILGDVSGKGLKAAMTGVLAIGSFRTLATEGLSPGELLGRLNQSLHRPEQSGFITCLCGQLKPDGRLTLANAGHLSPYLNGEEVPVESELPLGIATGIAYRETFVELAPGDVLVLLTDGVVEAQSASGELFGFDRTRSVCVQSPQQMAALAQAFGQNDDITVLSITMDEAVASG
jgi:sigma-B regulation protein RsbU (phosphoserine phosphatase)